MPTEGLLAGGALLQNCDVIEQTNTGATIYSFKNNGRGTAPCRLQIRNDGTLAIYDSQNVLWSVNAAPARPVAGSNQLTAGQDAPDVRPPLRFACCACCADAVPMCRGVSRLQACLWLALRMPQE